MVKKSPKKSFWNKLPRPFLALAPMAGITSQPFRLICKDFGVDLLFSEMISSEALWHKVKIKSQISNIKNNELLYKTLRLIHFSQKERPFIVQIFGSNPEHMANSAEYIASGQWAKDYNKISNFKFQIKNSSIPDGIDINMGCPARDIVKQEAGAALMKNHKLAGEIVSSIKGKIKIPVSVKTRLGWENSNDILKFAKKLENAGADALTIHGRTYRQGFIGPVDWQTIYQAKKQLKIPVIGNGGINEISNLKSQISNFDGIMVGQGALGNPWIFKKIKSQISNLKNNDNSIISLKERKEVVLRHAKLVEKLNGKRGTVEFRKHLLLYIKSFPNAKKIRLNIAKINKFNDIIKLINNL